MPHNNTTPGQEARLLDAITDAQRVYLRYRRGMFWFPALTVMSVLVTLAGAVVGNAGSVLHIDTGITAGFVIAIGIVGAIVFTIVTLHWYNTNGTGQSDLRSVLGPPEDQVIKAERALRDYRGWSL